MSDRDSIPTPDEFERSKPRKRNFIARLVARLRVKPGVGEEARRVAPTPPPPPRPPSIPATTIIVPIEEPRAPAEPQLPLPPPPTPVTLPVRRIVFRDDIARPSQTHRGSVADYSVPTPTITRAAPSPSTARWPRPSHSDKEAPEYVVKAREQYPRAYMPWSSEEERGLAASFKRGSSIGVLVEEFERQPGAIRSRLSRLGLTED
jgi:hypothetical protein